jgi:hypothetical protein
MEHIKICPIEFSISMLSSLDVECMQGNVSPCSEVCAGNMC